MTARKSQSDTNQEVSDNSVLVAYRLQAVENELKGLQVKFDKLDNIKRADLADFRDTIVTSFNSVQTTLQKNIDALGKDLQKQIDRLEREKAGSQDLKDLKKRMAAYGAFGGAILLATYSYLLTRLH